MPNPDRQPQGEGRFVIPTEGDPVTNISDAAKAARAIADRSIDPFDHARANAMEAAEEAERQALKFAANPPTGDTSDLPKWSEVSAPLR
jgi:hypothetical protein